MPTDTRAQPSEPSTMESRRRFDKPVPDKQHSTGNSTAKSSLLGGGKDALKLGLELLVGALEELDLLLVLALVCTAALGLALLNLVCNEPQKSEKRFAVTKQSLKPYRTWP